jgi:hypothetical protein
VIAYFTEHPDCPLVIGSADGILLYPVSGLHADNQHIGYDGRLMDIGNAFYDGLKINLGSIFSLSENSVPEELLIDLEVPDDQMAYDQYPTVDTNLAYFADHRDQPLIVGTDRGPVVYPTLGIYGDSTHVQQTSTGLPGTTAIDSGFAYYTSWTVNFGAIYSLSKNTVPFDILINWRGSAGTVWIGLYKNREALPFNGNGNGIYLDATRNPVSIGVDRVGQIDSLRMRIAAMSDVEDLEIARIEVRLRAETRTGS